MRRHLLAAALALTPLWAAAQTYKCRQPDGKVAFQDQPCQGAATGSQYVARPTPPSTDPAEIEKKKAAAANARAKAETNQNQQAADELKLKNQQAEAHNRAVRCDSARKNLGALKSERPVYRLDNKGERQYVDDDKRAAELAAAQRGIAENCN
ncbi:DUF4124 domain-containing protein [Caenimonas sedimenti]|uniref:DUF4124 domain-containing protein n=1 Tax=Caenimonas sedimenti TaxID=2596921 RepID=A0A562ZXM9_9BURK|nr:DUF4124 domain-containing protein [Caenimonas sedimenti]TWO73117.1 DUF4124 domain-containing protein [Caenimonas sedimenti]